MDRRVMRSYADAIEIARKEMERLCAAKDYDQARGAGAVFRALLLARGPKENVVQFPKQVQR